MENQEGLANRFQQEMRKLDKDVKQNEELLRRTYMQQKAARVRPSRYTTISMAFIKSKRVLYLF